MNLSPSSVYRTVVPRTDLEARTQQRTGHTLSWGNLTEVHRTVMSLFDTALPGESHERRSGGKILFQVGDRLVLVQSRVPVTHPTSASSTTVVDVGAPPAGSRVNFTVSARVIRRINKPGHGEVEVEYPGDAMDWLARRLMVATDGGAAPMRAVHITRHTSSQHMMVRSGVRVPVTLHTMHGLGTVNDSDAVTRLAIDGVGRGKAFGAGLLLVSERPD